MTGLFVRPAMVDALLAFVLLEALVMYAWHRRTGGGLAPRAIVSVLLPGACLMLALRAALAAQGGAVIAGWLLAALLARLLADRQLRVAPDVQAWLLARLPRTPAALGEAVARLDQAGLAARLPITRALARTTLAGWEGFSPIDDGTETNATGGSPPPVPLL